MKEKICKIVILCLCTLLLLNGCAIPNEPATENNPTSETTEEQTTEEITSEEITSEEITEAATSETVRETTAQELHNARFYELKQGAKTYSVHHYSPSKRPYYNDVRTSSYMVEVATNVFVSKATYEELKAEGENVVFLCRVFVKEVLETFYGEFMAETWVSDITREEVLMAQLNYKEILDSNQVAYYQNKDGMPEDHVENYLTYGFSCCMTLEEIENFVMPEGDAYIVIATYMMYK